jgi:hypothetical protein
MLRLGHRFYNRMSGVSNSFAYHASDGGAYETDASHSRKQKPRENGASTGATEGLGGEGGPLSLEQQQRGDLVPIENRNGASAGHSRHPSAIAPHSASPGPHRYVVNIRLGRWRNKV